MSVEPEKARARGLPGLGALVRQRREAKGISLRELARRLGVSPSLVSRIENGTAHPSVTTLYGLTAELGLPLDELTGTNRRPDGGPPAEDSAVVRGGARPVLDVGPGVVMELVSSAADPSHELLWMTYYPGASSSEDGTLVTHGGHETGLVLEGTLEVTLNDTTHRLERGDSITFDSGTPHLFRSIGSEPARAVWMNIGRDTGEAHRVSRDSARGH